MAHHPAILKVTDRIKRDVIGGAVDTAKEVMEAMVIVAKESTAENINQLYKELDDAALAVMRVCPSFAPPINVLHMVLGSVENDLDTKSTVNEAIRNIVEMEGRFNEFISTALDKIANIGAELINDGDRVFMFSMSSSVWKVLRRARQLGKSFTVLVTEARPGNEGLWTVDEMNKSGISVEVGIDACLAELIASSNVVFAGVDAVSANGGVFNKAGSYLCALTAKTFGIPFYFVTDTLKFDTATLLGLPFRSDLVQYHEVLGDRKYQGDVRVVGKLFDTTPSDLITAIVTELGPIHPSACVNVMWKMKLSRRISEYIPQWTYGKL